MKLKLALLCLSVLMGGFLYQAIGQNVPVSGNVTNKATGEPLVGATVSVKATATSTITDSKGNFSLNIPSRGSTLVVSYTGMKELEYAVGSTTTGIAIQLEDNAAATLTDVIVVGYGTQKITKVSGAISTVKAADIEKLRPTRAEEALQGMASGATVIQNGSPGSRPTVLVRGIPSFSGNDPAVVIDGVIQTLTDFNSINPADIESINLLKDAATTAIYGLKGGNGVIVVTTKSGRKNQKPDISVSSNYGVQEVMNKIGVLNASEYAAIINEGSTTAGGNVIFPDLSIIGKGTNWQNEVFKRAIIQSHNVSARGGGDRMAYFLSAGYVDQGGIVGGMDKSSFTRSNFTANLSFDLTPKLKFILNTTGVILKSKGIQENSFNSIIGSALNFDPTVTVLNNDPASVGKYGYSNLLLSEIFNPLTKLDNTYNKNTGNKLYGKFELQYDVLKNLKLTSRFGYTKYDDVSKSFTPLVFYGPLNVENTMNADGSTVMTRNGFGEIASTKHNSVTETKNGNNSFISETFANYNFNINGDHSFEAVAGFSFSKSTYNGMNATGQDVPFNSWEFADVSATTGVNTPGVVYFRDTTINGVAMQVRDSRGDVEPNLNAQQRGWYRGFRKNLSYFGRINYDYKSKYLASLSARRDGSYAFGIDNKFADFYSGSLGWVVSNEDFFHSDFIDYFKIRGSYGTTGNENVNPQSIQIITGGPSYGGTANSNGYNFSGVFYPGSTVGSAANTLLAWEKQLQANAGFELTFFKKRFSIAADYFQKKVEGLLFTPSASLYLGTVPIPTANIGSTKSSGVDLSIGYTETFSKSFRVNSSLTFTTSKNEVTATNSDGTAKIFGGGYFNGQSQTVTVFEKGFTPGYFYGYKTDGLFQNVAEVAAHATQNGAVPGDIRFVDMNKDGVINADDQTKIGDPFPDFTMGWGLNLEYKNFDFSAFTYASVGNDTYRAYERNANYSNKYRAVLARWTGEGSTNDARNPRYSFTDGNSNIRVSDRYVEDGSFVKIKNLQLGYTFPSSVTKKAFSRLRVYVQVKNAFTFTKYSGFDPEIAGGVLDTGVDRGAYPQARTFAFGLDIKL